MYWLFRKPFFQLVLNRSVRNMMSGLWLSCLPTPLKKTKTYWKGEGDVVFSSVKKCHGHECRALKKLHMTVLQFKRASFKSWFLYFQLSWLQFLISVIGVIPLILFWFCRSSSRNFVNSCFYYVEVRGGGQKLLSLISFSPLKWPW